MSTTRSSISTAQSIAASKAYYTSASRAKSMAALKQFLKEIEPTSQPDVLLAEDTKFGIMDSLLFEKSKPDKNGVHSNVKLIQKSFNLMKELVLAVQASPQTFDRVATIAYKPVNDKFHYILIRKLNINKNNIEKYLLLM
jgi:hypothetical protein